jgi:transcription antitermination factor NusG
MLTGPQAGCKSKGAKPIDWTDVDALGPASHTPAWYAAWTRSHCERAVAQQLSARGFETFLPEIATWSRRGGGAHLIQAPMFPGYLFVRTAIDKQRYVEMLKARGLVRVLGDGWDRLTPVAAADIDAIQRVVDAKLPVLPHAHVTCGDRVVVVTGPLAGVEGIFVQHHPQKGRLVVSVDLLGRSVAVEIDRSAIVPSLAIAS